MEQMRELSMDEMNKVSGGSGTDKKDGISYWIKDNPCPNCGESRESRLKLISHTCGSAYIYCYSCYQKYKVHK